MVFGGVVLIALVLGVCGSEEAGSVNATISSTKTISGLERALKLLMHGISIGLVLSRPYCQFITTNVLEASGCSAPTRLRRRGTISAVAKG